MPKYKLLVGKIKNNVADWKGLEGLTLLVTKYEDEEKLLVHRPICIEEMEMFYKATFENELKDVISTDYDYCLWYLLYEDCELSCVIDITELEDIREATVADVNLHDENLEKFKRLHKVYEYQKKIEEEEKQESAALKEFENEAKSKVEVMTKEGNEEVDAVIYKGFAIHNKVCDIPMPNNPYKAISVIAGEFKGYGLTSCNITKYKSLIDEIREAIGDREIIKTDSEVLRPIIEKY